MTYLKTALIVRNHPTFQEHFFQVRKQINTSWKSDIATHATVEAPI